MGWERALESHHKIVREKPSKMVEERRSMGLLADKGVLGRITETGKEGALLEGGEGIGGATS